MVANTHTSKNDSLINMLDNRLVPMPDYLFNQILQGVDSISEKEKLEAQRAFWSQEVSKHYSNLIKYYKGDSLPVQTTDSLIQLLVHRNTLEAFYDIVSIYNYQNEFTQANNILNSIPTLFVLDSMQLARYQDYCTFFNQLHGLRIDTISVFNIDSVRKVLFENIVSNEHGAPSVFARNLLLYDNKIAYEEPIYLPESGLKSAKKEKHTSQKGSASNSPFKIHPNPATDKIVIDYGLNKELGNGTLIICDVVGRLISSTPIDPKCGQQVIITTNLPNGQYVVSLQSGDRTVETGKFSIIR